MRRMTVLLGICVLLFGAALSATAQISIAGDTSGKEMTIDISLRDADLNEVITALFNTTGGKFQVQVSGGVVGRINRLQLTQTPFDKVLDAVLGTEYTYVKQELGMGKFLYRISGGGTRVPAPVGGPIGGGTAPLMAPPSTSVAGGSSETTGTGLPTFMSPVINITTKPTGATGTDPSASETSVVRLIRVTYADVGLLAEAFGGTYVDFSPETYSTNGTTGGGRRNNNNSYNNNDYNNNYNDSRNNRYNNNNYNDPNTSRTRTTRTSSRDRATY